MSPQAIQSSVPMNLVEPINLIILLVSICFVLLSLSIDRIHWRNWILHPVQYDLIQSELISPASLIASDILLTRSLLVPML